MNYKIYPINKFAVHTTKNGATIIRTHKGIVATNKPVKVIHKEDLNLEGKDEEYKQADIILKWLERD